ncbi:MAG TPA: hypothetical protein VHB48_21695 [Chitinophagaceae bacterium]|nr:hypothetical protein [Chitinophagaceae bacterium]
MSLFSYIGDYARLMYRMIFVPAKEQTIHFDEAGWTITIPKGFEVLTDKRISVLKTKGDIAFGALAGGLVNYPGKTRVAAIHEIQNVFGIDFTNLDEFPESVWKQQKNNLHNTILSGMYEAYKGFAYVNIATETDARQKGEVVFETFEIIITTPQRELRRIRYFSTVYKNYGIHIVMSFAEPKAGEQMLDALRNSTFTV